MSLKELVNWWKPVNPHYKEEIRLLKMRNENRGIKPNKQKDKTCFFVVREPEIQKYQCLLVYLKQTVCIK